MGWRLKFNEKEKAEIVLVQGKPFLYYCYKLDHDTVPKNLFVYEVADDGSNGCFCRIAKYILVNHWGTLVGKYELDLNEDGRYYPEEDSDEYYMDCIDYMSAEDYDSYYPATDIDLYNFLPMTDIEIDNHLKSRGF